MNIDYSLIGSRIKARRRELRMTQEMMAEALDVSVGYVSQVERGVTKISLDLLANISSILCRDLAYFVSGAATDGGEYLNKEVLAKFSKLSARDKRIVLGLIDVMCR